MRCELQRPLRINGLRDQYPAMKRKKLSRYARLLEIALVYDRRFRRLTGLGSCLGPMAYNDILSALRNDCPITPGKSIFQEIADVYCLAAATAMRRARKFNHLTSVIVTGKQIGRAHV